MRRRKFCILLVGSLLAFLAACLLWLALRGGGDEQRFDQLARSRHWGWRLQVAERRLPAPLVRLFHISNLKNKYLRKADAQEEALLASGYLTNASFIITNSWVTASNVASLVAELQRRLSVGARIPYMAFYVQTNRAVITCRTRDVPLIRTALESP